MTSIDDDFTTRVRQWWRLVDRPEDWSNVAVDVGEFRSLFAFLDQASEEDILRMAPRDFGAIGDAITWLTEPQFVYLMPVLARLACVSEESVFAHSFVTRLHEVVPSAASWEQLRIELPNALRSWLSRLACQCCDLGWAEQKRIDKWKERSRKLLS